MGALHSENPEVTKRDLPLEQDFDISAIQSLEGRGGRDFGTESFKLPVRETTKIKTIHFRGHVAEIRTHRGFGYREVEGSRFGCGGFMKLRIPKSQKVHTDKVSGKSPKGHFGISATGRCRGKSSELLTHEILKGSEPLDAGGSQLLIFL
jgi:hypothetical protein